MESIKITTISSGKPRSATFIKQLQYGTVFMFEGGVTALKTRRGKFLLLNFSSGDAWLEVGGEEWDETPISKIYGKICEIRSIENE